MEKWMLPKEDRSLVGQFGGRFNHVGMTPDSKTIDLMVWQKMALKKNVKIRWKRKSRLMKNIAWALDKRGYCSKDQFMNHFSTVLKNTVYLAGSKSMNVTTLAHELRHVDQYRKHKGTYWLKYCSDSRYRTACEVSGYASGMAVSRMLIGRVPSVDRVMRSLDSYGLTDDDKAWAKKQLEALWKLPIEGNGGLRQKFPEAWEICSERVAIIR